MRFFNKKWLNGPLAVATTVSLAGCGSGLSDLPGSDHGPEVPVTHAALPSVVQPYERIDNVLACIRATGVLRGLTFVVGPFADSTGKINTVAMGATGAFVPQGGSAAYITDAIAKAGGRVVSTYFGAPALNAPAQYAVNGIFNSLDFGTPLSADVRIAGVGPTAQIGWAQLTLSVQLDEAGTRLNRQMSMVQRPVRYTQLGAGAGAIAGHTLVTGNVALQNQERLQFEALNGPIALGVADVLLKEFPVARAKCGPSIEDLLHPETAGQIAEAREPIDPKRQPKAPEPKSVPSQLAAAPEAEQGASQRLVASRTSPRGSNAAAAGADMSEGIRGGKGVAYELQLGSARSEREATQVSAKVSAEFSDVLGGRTPAILPDAEKSVFRVRVGGFGREEAREVCQRITLKGGSCWVVKS